MYYLLTFASIEVMRASDRAKLAFFVNGYHGYGSETLWVRYEWSDWLEFKFRLCFTGSWNLEVWNWLDTRAIVSEVSLDNPRDLKNSEKKNRWLIDRPGKLFPGNFFLPDTWLIYGNFNKYIRISSTLYPLPLPRYSNTPIEISNWCFFKTYFSSDSWCLICNRD